MVNRPSIFKNFGEYLYYSKHMSKKQRKIIYDSLPSCQQLILDNSFSEEGWNELLYRNDINDKIDELAEDYGFSLIDIRVKALKGKSVYVPCKFWIIAKEQMDKFKPEVVSFVMDGLKAKSCKENTDVCLIIHEKYEVPD